MHESHGAKKTLVVKLCPCGGNKCLKGLGASRAEYPKCEFAKRVCLGESDFRTALTAELLQGETWETPLSFKPGQAGRSGTDGSGQ